MQSRSLAKSQSHAARVKSIESRVLAPALEAQETVSPLHTTSVVPRSQSYSKTSRYVNVCPAFQRLKTRIMKYESSDTLQTPRLREGTKRSPIRDESRNLAKLHASLILPRGFRASSNSPFTTRDRPSPRPNPLIQSELLSSQPHQKAYLKQLLRNLKQVELSKRNLWKHRVV